MSGKSSSSKPAGVTVLALILTVLDTVIVATSVSTFAATDGRAVERMVTREAPEHDRSAMRARREQGYGKVPLQFEANQGQTDDRVKFISRGKGYTLFLTPTETVLSLREGRADDATTAVADAEAAIREAGEQRTENHAERVVRMRLVAGNASPEMVGVDELPGKANYFIGDEPAKWRTNVATYGKVRLRDVYPGIDLVYYGNEGFLEHDFIVAPDAEPAVIRLAFEGADRMHLDVAGNLVLEANGSRLLLRSPEVYQESDGKKTEVAARYILENEHQARFEIAAYDTTRPLIIDPILAYSTYLGGSLDDWGHRIALDANGNAYVVGTTLSTDFPTAGAYQAANAGGRDVIVTKLDPTGSAIVYSTYLGGGNNDYGNDIAVDSSGNAYVTGSTYSATFPTENPFQGTRATAPDAFVTKLDANGSSLVYSTFLGGNATDAGQALAIDSVNNAYVTGNTNSTNFPVLNPIKAGHGQYDPNDVFITKLDATGSNLVYSTYLGGNMQYPSGEQARDIAVDASGNAYVTGWTTSVDFPTKNAFDSTKGGGTSTDGPNDAFVSKINPAGNALVYSTFLGGGSITNDWAYGIAVDDAGSAYVTGTTASPDFPTANPIQATRRGPYDGFVTKFTPAGTALVYSTYFGGSAYPGNDQGLGIALDSSGSAHVVGFTSASNFPVIDPIQGTFAGGNDLVVVKLNPAGSAFAFATFLGGSSNDLDWNNDPRAGIALDDTGNVYITASTSSSNFPTVGPVQGTSGGGRDGVVAKIQTLCQSGPDCDDADACTTDVCDPGDPGADNFGCVYGSVDCDDHNVCTDDSCNPSSGCVYTNNSAPCDDGQECTSDVCTDGVCVGTLNASECLDHFVFYKTKTSLGAPRFVKFGPLQLTDQFGQSKYDVLIPKQLGLPADKNGEGTEDSATHLMEYKIKAVAGSVPFAGLTDVRIENQCNDLLVEVKKPVSVLVPTSKDLTQPVPPPDPLLHNLDHFLCYKAKAQKFLATGIKLPKFPKGTQVEIVDQFHPLVSRRYDLKKISKLCNPVDKTEEPGEPPILLSGSEKGTVKTVEPATIRNAEAHLVCYRATLAKRYVEQDGCGCAPSPTLCKGVEMPSQPGLVTPNGVYLSNQFGAEQNDVIKETEICIPSLKTVAAP